ncbi:unnamed protein product [Brachionus calyciflorus]|uniref:Peptidase S1 domain-containing protein n=1 Tax=Brachionus calyciflorus TaxID=104777 RepID=A0A814ALZ5_9BILA|nr:unnamed protein product [Brachionus calyciflorus]
MWFSSLLFFIEFLLSFFYQNKIEAEFNFDCGIPDLKPQTKIVNGKDANSNAWPWMVAMFFENSFQCGGSIIAPDLILTAAHCVEDDLDVSKYKFIYGTNYINQSQTESNTAFVSKIYMHPDYFGSIIYNDIALIKLKNKLQFSSKVKPICLPQNGKLDEIENKQVVVTGWGKRNGSLPISNNLLQALMAIQNDKSENACNFRRYNNYCALGVSGDSNICQGDSGGPLQYFKNGKWIIYGISSYTLSNQFTSCDNKEPGFFATVPFFLDWIKSVAKGKPDKPVVKKNCGLKTLKGIFGVENEWPWIVTVRIFEDNFFEYGSIGTLISNQHVLTLKNKLAETELSSIFVTLGSNVNLYYPDLDKVYSVINIHQISDELVVLKLHRPVTNPNVSPICLPNSKQASLIFNKNIVTAGWVSTDPNEDFSSSYIRDTSLTVDNENIQCKNYSKSSYCTFANKTELCFEDLGNPLMFPVENKWTLFGIYYQLTTDSNEKKCINEKMSLAFNIINNLNAIESALN